MPGWLQSSMPMLSRVGDDADVGAVPQRTADLRGGGAGSNADGLVGLDEIGCGESDAPLLDSGSLFACLEAAVIAERLIEQGLNQHGAAMRTAYESAAFQTVEGAADGGRRGANSRKQLIDGG